MKSLVWAPNPIWLMADVIIRGTFEHRNTHGEYQVKNETEIGVMPPQAKECQGLPVVTRSCIYKSKSAKDCQLLPEARR